MVGEGKNKNWPERVLGEKNKMPPGKEWVGGDEGGGLWRAPQEWSHAWVPPNLRLVLLQYSSLSFATVLLVPPKCSAGHQ